MSHDELPHCVGFIMDGNRRYAETKGEDRLLGHVAGFETFKSVVRWLREKSIVHGVFYAFSTENWKRSQAEVDQLLCIFEDALREQHEKTEPDLHTDGVDGVRVRFIGRREDFAPELQTLMAELEKRSARYTTTTIWIALSYGGRAELLEAVNKAIVCGLPVDETAFRQKLWSAELPDVDLLIRTSGEQRLSNFLPWQLSYSELHFTPTLWPAFTKDEFTSILSTYALRRRRHGV
jgi:undecaprenyl diphosphate synthase